MLCVLASAAASQGLEMPAGARLTSEDETALGSYALPTGPFAEGRIPAVSVEGRILRQSWRLPGTQLTLLQIMAPLREQIRAAGFEILLDCKANGCGGFDFRFATEVMPGPGMYVDLTDFRFLSARGEGDAAVSVLVSRSSSAGFVQVIRVGTAAQAEGGSTPETAEPPVASGPLAETLESRGRLVLSDLSFETGSSDLGDGSHDSLAALARYLADNPNRRIAIVGHTDSVGALDSNIALSRRRAASVLERLVGQYGVNRTQLEAGGMGYLAPLRSNLTGEGRDANRRVEAVLVSTE